MNVDRTTRRALALLLVCSFFNACKIKEGDHCTPGRATCVDSHSGFFCDVDGRYHAVLCRGTLGCRQEGALVSCDQSVAASGDVCTRPGLACTADGDRALACQGRRFVVAETCLGARSCRVAFDEVLCDHDVARPGDPCREDGDYACTLDRDVVLRCEGKQLRPLSSCRGPGLCSIQHPRPTKTDFACDSSMAVEGDPCAADGAVACSVDGTMTLTCSSGRFGAPQRCPAGACVVTRDGALVSAACGPVDGGPG